MTLSDKLRTITIADISCDLGVSISSSHSTYSFFFELILILKRVLWSLWVMPPQLTVHTLCMIPSQTRIIQSKF